MNAGDKGGNIIALMISLILLYSGLFILVKMLKMLLLRNATGGLT